MESLFGVPMAGLALALAGLLAVGLAALSALGLRNRIFVKLGLRNIPRRRAQTVLIVIGLMLSTMIIAASLGVGDTVAYSIRAFVLDGLGYTDETVRSASFAFLGDDYLGEDAVAAVRAVTDGDARVDGVLPQIRETLPVFLPRTSKTEARTVVAGFDPASLDGFGDLANVSGARVSLGDLGPSELYLNKDAAERLGAVAGDEVLVVTRTGRHRMAVRDVLRRGGLSGADPRALLTLPVLQRLVDREGRVNRIDISNRGGLLDGRDLSEEVTRDLRIALTDPAIAGQLFSLLRGDEVARAIEARAETAEGLPRAVTDDLRTVAGELRKEAPTDRFRSLIADDATGPAVVVALEAGGRPDLAARALPLLARLQSLRVSDIKVDLLAVAETVGNFFTTIFAVLGSFSIIVGVLLIFLVFVMLAAARSTDMGIARAIGTKRSHLVQLFTYEGAAYSLMAGVVGTALGVAAAIGLVVLLTRAIGTNDDTFTIRQNIQLRSIVAAFSAGVVLTLATVVISAYRVSRLNIVVAIRGLGQEFARSEALPFGERLAALLWAVATPVAVLRREMAARAQGSATSAAGLVVTALSLPVAWPWRLLSSFFRLWSPYLGTGVPAIMVGLLLAVSGLQSQTAAGWMMGVSIFMIGAGQLLRRLLALTAMRPAACSRLSATVTGAVILVFWSLPFDTLESLTGKLQSNIEMFILSGVWMVGASVWVIMYNAEVATWLADKAFARLGSLKPVVRTAIAYPMAAKFRTGLTVAMFSLVIFTLMVFAILNNLGNVIEDDPGRVTGGFDIRATIASDLPIADIDAAIEAAPELDRRDFTRIARSAEAPGEARQPGAEELAFKPVAVRALDRSYLEATRLTFTHYDPSYGRTARDIWAALENDPSLAVLNAQTIFEGGGGFGDFGAQSFRVEGIKSSDPEEIESFEIEVRAPGGRGKTTTRRVIAFLDPFANALDNPQRGPQAAIATLFSGPRVLADLFDRPVPFTIYRFRLREGVDARETAARLETVFLDNSMKADATEEQIARNQAQSNAFNLLFQGFMGLGLFVGVAALGVLSFRAVVERRQSIGMLRALGFKAWMIEAEFLIESSVVALLGVALGLGLGTLISWNIVNDLSDQVEGLKFIIPWLNVAVIVAVAYVFAMLTTIWPARQAARVYPSEALRYE